MTTKKILMLFWLFTGIYFIIASAGGQGFISPVLAMVCGFMVARNLADIVRLGANINGPEGSNHMQADPIRNETSRVPTASAYEGAKKFTVIRAGVTSDRKVTLDEVHDFLDACGLVPDSIGWELALAGGAIHIDGAQIQFIPIDEENDNGEDSATPMPQPIS